MEVADLDRLKKLAIGQERDHLHRSTMNGALISAIPYQLNVKELSQE